MILFLFLIFEILPIVCFFSSVHRLVEQSTGDVKISDTLLTTAYFRCGSGEFVSIIARCDRVKDCLDTSDEVNCTYLKDTIGF
jgi:hypothetical protein